MKNGVFGTCLSLIIFLVLAGCSSPGTSGKVVSCQGKVDMTMEGSLMPAGVGMMIKSGDSIITGDDGVVIIDLINPEVKLEVQPGARLVLDRNKLNVSEGSVWSMVAKLKKKRSFNVTTPSAVVGVRGTKFYINGVGSGMQTICHCEGNTLDTDVASGKSEEVSRDSLTFIKDGKRIVLGPDELKEFGVVHDHSVLDDSPLGKRATPDPVMMKKMMDYVGKKFADLK